MGIVFFANGREIAGDITYLAADDLNINSKTKTLVFL